MLIFHLRRFIFGPFSFPALLCVLACGQDLEKEKIKNTGTYRLPEWFSTHPAYLNPVAVDSVLEGFGSIFSNQSQNLGWVIELNAEPGYGIDIVIEELNIDVENNDYLIVAGWPIPKFGFKTLKMFTGRFSNLPKLRILNSKKFFVLFNAEQSKVSPKLALTYKRYGKSYIKQTTVTEEPIVENSAIALCLKGRNPKNYSDDFQMEMKRVIRRMAKTYALANNIRFDDQISVNDMIIFHKISFCPLEWPEREICAIVEHSVFVSGEKNPNGGVTVTYELTSEHLEDMWSKSNFIEIEELGLMLFELPKISSIIMLWSVAIGVVVLSSLIIILLFREVEKRSKEKKKPQADSEVQENSALKKKVKVKSPKHPQLSKFNSSNFESDESFINFSTNGTLMNKSQDDSSIHLQQPLQNYFGSILFFNNTAFDVEEDDEAQETSG